MDVEKTVGPLGFISWGLIGASISLYYAPGPVCTPAFQVGAGPSESEVQLSVSAAQSDSHQ